jgi:hypothetical protein
MAPENGRSPQAHCHEGFEAGTLSSVKAPFREILGENAPTPVGTLS